MKKSKPPTYFKYLTNSSTWLLTLGLKISWEIHLLHFSPCSLLWF